MRVLTSLFLCALTATGCSWLPHRNTVITAPMGAQGTYNTVNRKGNANQPTIVSEETILTGKVLRVQENARFAVVNFPIGSVPPNGRQFGVYRQGLKVGVVRVSGPRQNDDTVVDITEGTAQVGDELRGN